MLACDIKIPNTPPRSPPGGGNQYRTLSIPLHQQAEWHQRVSVCLFLWIEFKDCVTLACNGRNERRVTVITSKVPAEKQQTTFLHHNSALQRRHGERAAQTDGSTSVWEDKSNDYPPGKVTGDYFGIYEHFLYHVAFTAAGKWPRNVPQRGSDYTKWRAAACLCGLQMNEMTWK